MKKTGIIKRSIAALMMIAAVSFAIGIGTAASVKAATPSDTEFLANGAYVRLPDLVEDNGIRFNIIVEKSYYETEMIENGEPKAGVETGVLVVPEALLNGNELTLEEVKTADNGKHASDKKITGLWTDAGKLAANECGIYVEAETGTEYMTNYAYLFNIPETLYDEEIAFRGYITTAEGTSYTNTLVRSMSEVAYQAIKANPDYEESLGGYLYEYDVTFNDLGEKTTVKVKYGDSVAEPSSPNQGEILEFTGWYLGEDPYDFTTPVKSDIELVAEYNGQGTYKISRYIRESLGDYTLYDETTGSGNIGESVSASLEDIDGYVFEQDKSILTGIIPVTGELNLSLYYTDVYETEDNINGGLADGVYFEQSISGISNNSFTAQPSIDGEGVRINAVSIGRYHFFRLHLSRPLDIDAHAGIKVKVKLASLTNSNENIYLKFVNSSVTGSDMYSSGNRIKLSLGEWTELTITAEQINAAGGEYGDGEITSLLFGLIRTDDTATSNGHIAGLVVNSLIYVEKLDSPGNAQYDEDTKTVSWDAVVGAEGYIIKVNGQTDHTVTDATTYQLTETDVFAVQIYAFAEKMIDSDIIDVYGNLLQMTLTSGMGELVKGVYNSQSTILVNAPITATSFDTADGTSITLTNSGRWHLLRFELNEELDLTNHDGIYIRLKMTASQSAKLYARLELITSTSNSANTNSAYQVRLDVDGSPDTWVELKLTGEQIRALGGEYAEGRQITSLLFAIMRDDTSQNQSITLLVDTIAYADKLTSPVSAVYDETNKTVSWNVVSGADAYVVTINGESSYTVTDNTNFVVTEQNVTSIQLKAIGSGKFDSDMIDVYGNLTRLIPVSGIEGDVGVVGVYKEQVLPVTGTNTQPFVPTVTEKANGTEITVSSIGRWNAFRLELSAPLDLETYSGITITLTLTNSPASETAFFKLTRGYDQLPDNGGHDGWAASRGVSLTQGAETTLTLTSDDIIGFGGEYADGEITSLLFITRRGGAANNVPIGIVIHSIEYISE